MYDFAPILARLKEAKRESGMTNEELSRSSGVSIGTLNKILSGDTQEPKLPALMAIAHALGVSVDYLIYGRHPQPPAAPDIEAAKVALFGGDGEVTDEMWEEALFAAQMIKERYRRKKND